MAFKYKAVPKKNPQNPTAPPLFYASPVYTGDVTIRQLAEKIAMVSTVSSIDVLAVLEAFLQLIPLELIESRIVRLRYFGTFRVTVKSKGQPTADDLSAVHIEKMRLLFRPYKEFSELVGSVKYEKQ